MKNILIPMFAINGTASYPAGVIAVRGPVTVDGVEYYAAKGEESAETGVHTYADYEATLEPEVAAVDPVMVSPKDLVLLFPDEALAELEDLATDKSKPKKDRGRARKVSTILSSGEPLDVASYTFKALLTWATGLDSFSEADITRIKAAYNVA